MSRKLARVSGSSSTTRMGTGSGSAMASPGGVGAVVPGQLSQGRQEPGYVERLVADQVGPLGHDLLDEPVHLRAVARDQDGTGPGVRTADHPEDAAAVGPRQLQVDQGDVQGEAL